MKIGRGLLLLAVFAAALLTLTVRQSHATCTGDNKILHSSSDAECLSASSQSNPLLRASRWTIQNTCSGFGTVVAKIELSGASDRTVSLSDKNAQTGSSYASLTGIYCCKDSGDLCKKADLVTASSCRTRFEAAPVGDSCTLDRDPTVSDSDTQCEFEMTCSGASHTRTVAWLSVPDLNYCSGSFTSSDCSEPAQ